MNHIINMAILGIFAGMITGFWTRIIKSNMIFGKFGRIILKASFYYKPGTDIPATKWWGKLLTCIFCLPPWICLVFCLFYILEYQPWCLYAVIGVFCAFGTANTTVEIIKALRNE